MTSEYTAERLIKAADTVEKFKHLLARELADTLHIYGYAWQAEVKALRERIAALEAEREAGHAHAQKEPHKCWGPGSHCLICGKQLPYGITL